MDLDDLSRINRAWLYKDPKVLALQANGKLVQKRVLNLETKVSGSILTGGNIMLLEFFCFHAVKTLMHFKKNFNGIMCRDGIGTQWQIQDFPEVEAPTLQGVPTCDFAKFPQKTARNRKNLDANNASLTPAPLDPPMGPLL